MKRLRFRPKSDSSKLEAKFTFYWRGLGGPPLVPEFRFDPTRRWRADFAHIESRTLIEIEGGLHIFGGGRHNRAAGFIGDCEKYLHAWLVGWSVVRLTATQITAPTLERIIRKIQGSCAGR
jgi:very-short-patch-repair endonuclease